MVILAPKNLYLSLENIFFRKPEVGYVCLWFVCGKLALNGVARAFRHYYSGLNLMSYDQSNNIWSIINILTYIYVIHMLICNILDLNLGKIQLQFTAIYLASIFAGAT